MHFLNPDLSVQTSCSLQHLPIDVERETKLDGNIKKKLAFAIQKLAELKRLATSPPSKGTVSDAANKQPPPDSKLFSRPADYQTRRKAQFEKNPKVRYCLQM
jgi:5-methyltetrahydropteroyltriglutamate--homocysteine methyltransferase